MSHRHLALVAALLFLPALPACSGETSTVVEKTGAAYILVNAASFGDVELVTELIDSGSDVNMLDPATDRTPLMAAAQGGHVAVTRILLLSDADPNIKQTKTGDTALMMAAASGQLAIVKELLSEGAMANDINDAGHTAHDLAEQSGHADIVAVLAAAK